jgi:ribosome-associated toxin RatA of RatAB toxin-antitoxin module
MERDESAAASRRIRRCRRIALAFSISLLLTRAAWAQLPSALASPACIACEVDAAQRRQNYTDEEWQRILADEIVVSDMQNQGSADLEGMVHADALVRHPPKQVWHVLVDFESRPEYISDVERIAIVRQEGNRVWADEHLRFLFVDVRYRVMTTIDPETGSISWELDQSVPHDIDDVQGLWRVTPYSGGKETLLSYRTRIDTGRGVPGFVQKFLLTRSLPEFIRSLRGEVTRRFPR